jgi:hypothetical protein
MRTQLAGDAGAVGGGQTLDRADLPAVTLHGEHQAGPDRVAVHQDRAGPADAVLATQMRAGEIAVLP